MEQTVLLVDDDDNLLRGLARTLRHQPYCLLTTRSAEEAMWTLKTRPVDLIVSDERMPGMSGCDLLAWVAENYPAVIRIMLTGQATMATTLRAINEGGVYHFFLKPCDVVQLALTIRMALEGKRLIDENQRLAKLTESYRTLPEEILGHLERLEQFVRQGLCQPLERIADRGADGPVRKAAQAATETRQAILLLQERCRPILEVVPAGEASGGEAAG